MSIGSTELVETTLLLVDCHSGFQRALSFGANDKLIAVHLEVRSCGALESEVETLNKCCEDKVHLSPRKTKGTHVESAGERADQGTVDLLHAKADPRPSGEWSKHLFDLLSSFGIHPTVRIETQWIRVECIVRVHQNRRHSNRCSSRNTPVIVEDVFVRDACHAGPDGRAHTQPLHQYRREVGQLL